MGKELKYWSIQDFLNEAEAYSIEIEKRKALGEPTSRQEELRECCLIAVENLKNRGRKKSEARKGIGRLRYNGAAVPDRDSLGITVPSPGTLSRSVYDLFVAGKHSAEILAAFPDANRRSVINFLSKFRSHLKSQP